MARLADPNPSVINAMQELGLSHWIRRPDRAARNGVDVRDEGPQRVAVVVPATPGWRRELGVMLGAALGTGPLDLANVPNTALRPHGAAAQPMPRWVREAAKVGLVVCSALAVVACAAAMIDRIAPRRR